MTGAERRAVFFEKKGLRALILPANKMNDEEARRGSRLSSKVSVVEALMISTSIKYQYRNPKPGVSANIFNSNRGHCVRRDFASDLVCECFPPYRGPVCEFLDLPRKTSTAKNSKGMNQHVEKNYYSDAGPQHEETERRNFVHYTVDSAHLDELRFALHNLWEFFNKQHDYPVLLFHDDSFSEAEFDTLTVEILPRQQNRVWLYLMEKPNHIGVHNWESSTAKGHKTAAHHSKAGYAEQARFRAFPLFKHPAVEKRFKFAWGLDTDSYFPREVEADVFPPVESDQGSSDSSRERTPKAGAAPAPVHLGYKYITRSTPANSQNLYAWLQMFLQTQPVWMQNKFLLWPSRMSGMAVAGNKGSTGESNSRPTAEDVGRSSTPSFMSSPLLSADIALAMNETLAAWNDGSIAFLPENRLKATEQALAMVLEHVVSTSNLQAGTTGSADDDEREPQPPAEDNFRGSTSTPSFQEHQLQPDRSSTTEPLYQKLLITLPEYPLGFTWSLGVVMTDCEIVDVEYITGRRGVGGGDEDARVTAPKRMNTYEQFFHYVDSLQGQIKHRWGDHAVRALGMAVSLYPEEIARNRTLSWEMKSVPYAHQAYCDCGDKEKFKCVKIWDRKRWVGNQVPDTLLATWGKILEAGTNRKWTVDGENLGKKKLFTCVPVGGG
ncbi:unnamed protein product [Amoebophrya sp. A120]|nr:unnamed protein product [Amoebophrya sp. A120]|eukprot:GSA120T00024994001.1